MQTQSDPLQPSGACEAPVSARTDTGETTSSAESGGRPFGFWLTGVVGAGGLILSIVLAGLLLAGLELATEVLKLPPPQRWWSGIGREVVVFFPLTVFVCGWVILWAKLRWNLRDYLALVWPSRREILLGLGLFAGFLIVSEALCRVAGIDPITPWQRQLFSGCGWQGLTVLFVMIVVCAPLWEELLFRGFCYCGWARTVLRPAGAIILSSILWATLHRQYDLFFVLMVFTYGLLLGYVRRRSGSLPFCIFLHALNNLISFGMTYYVVFLDHPSA